ncbi:MAG: hypothetical protein HY904_15755 [Deltaproteobacteria bacterium]|nr:hypothetical protein [Deltaproteobacteria bacterium]
MTAAPLPPLLAWSRGDVTRIHIWDGHAWAGGPELAPPAHDVVAWSPAASAVLVHEAGGAVTRRRLDDGGVEATVMDEAADPWGITMPGGATLCAFGRVRGVDEGHCWTPGDGGPGHMSLGGMHALQRSAIPVDSEMLVMSGMEDFGGDSLWPQVVHASTFHGYYAVPGVMAPGSSSSFSGLQRECVLPHRALAVGQGMGALDDGGMSSAVAVFGLTLAGGQLAYAWGRLVSGGAEPHGLVDQCDDHVLLRDDDGWLRIWEPYASAQPGPRTVRVDEDARGRATGAVAALWGLDSGGPVMVSLPDVQVLWRLPERCDSATAVRALDPQGRAVVMTWQADALGAVTTGYTYATAQCRSDFPGATPVVNSAETWVAQDDGGVARLYWMDADGALRAAPLDGPGLHSPGAAFP